jgi:hypothetical protein
MFTHHPEQQQHVIVSVSFCGLCVCVHPTNEHQQYHPNGILLLLLRIFSDLFNDGVMQHVEKHWQ